MLLWLFPLFIAVVLVSSRKSDDKRQELTKTIDNRPMRRPGKCYENSKLEGSGIHIFVIASPYFYQRGQYLFHRQAMEYYSNLHGYTLRFVDPQPILDKFGNIKPDRGNGPIISSKSLIMLYLLRELFSTHFCNAKWALFLDADFIVTDLARNVQSMIDTASKVLNGEGGSCDVLVQDGPTTINSGFVLVKVSERGDKILSNWKSVHVDGAARSVEWQDDQGWLQQTYLKSIASAQKATIPLDCTENLQTLYGEAASVPKNSVRNLCYAKNLDLWKAHPAKQAYDGMCVLPGLSVNDRLNLHDWPGDHYVSDHGEYYFTLKAGDAQGRTRQCRLSGVFAYHGKVAAVVNQIKDAWPTIKRLTLKRLGLASSEVDEEGRLIVKTKKGVTKDAATAAVRRRAFAQLNTAEAIHVYDATYASNCVDPITMALQHHGRRTDWMPAKWREIAGNFTALQ